MQHIIKVSTSQGGLEKSGSEKAPESIVGELKNIWTDSHGSEPKYELDEIKIDDETDLNKIHETIFKQAKGKTGIFLGGDHAITYSLFKAFASSNKNAGLIIFDAHPDVYHMFNFVTHGDWVKYLIDEKIISPENIMIIGIRNADKKELAYLKEKKVNHILMQNMSHDVEDSCDAVMEFANKFPSFYLSIDIDVVDPAFAPGTGYPEPCGMTSRELLYFVQRLKLLKGLKVADIVEVNPRWDVNNMTSKLAAKILAELL